MSTLPTRSDTDVVRARAYAQVIDLVMMLFVFLVVDIPVAIAIVIAEVFFGASGGVFDWMPFLAGTFAFLGYNVFLESIWDGQTIGKRIFGVRVIMEDGTAVDAWAAFVRNLPVISSYGYVPYLVAYLSMASTDRRQRLFDRVAGTVVVSEEFGK